MAELASLFVERSLSPSVPGMVERGHIHRPALDVVRAMARVLGASLDWLVDEVGPAPTPEQVRAAVQAARAARSSGAGAAA